MRAILRDGRSGEVVCDNEDSSSNGYYLIQIEDRQWSVRPDEIREFVTEASPSPTPATSDEEVTPETGYYDKKHDQGKPRWSLFKGMRPGMEAVLCRYAKGHGGKAGVENAVITCWWDGLSEDNVARLAIECLLALSEDGKSLMPGLEQVAAVLAYGAEKYEAHSWQNVPDAKVRYGDAMLRHGIAHLPYSDNGTLQFGVHMDLHEASRIRDPESGLSHLAHCATDALFWLSL